MVVAARSGEVPVTTALVVVVALLLFAATAVAGLGGFARWWTVLGAGGRGAVQLLAVALVISHIVDTAVLVIAFILAMYAVATRTAGRRITSGRTWVWAGVPIVVGVAPVVAVLILSQAVPRTGLVLIPLVGQLIGGALVATSLAGRRLLDELRQRHGEVEAALSLGFIEREARWEIAQPVAGDALIPALDQTRTVGTVTLPGAFVGMLLGGASPLQAGIVQLFVLIALLAVEALAILLALHVIAAGLLHRDDATGTQPASGPPAGRLRRWLGRRWRLQR